MRRICSCFDTTEPDHLRGVGIASCCFSFLLFRVIFTSSFLLLNSLFCAFTLFNGLVTLLI
ncbi:uncharacterized protein METZ01_LOCUS49812 [marine metagenome]|uniref:Uncharacterized protein n=1 Tax=marine metagenome TaxID=408172 RepID=A0A381S0W0_9ZZZZ